MATFTKKLLSGSTNGRSIKVAATASPGTTIHTATALTGTAGYDEIWLWATNTSTSAVKLTLQWGGTTATDDDVELTIPGEAGPVPIIEGWLLQNGLLVRAYAATTNVITINGYAHLIS